MTCFYCSGSKGNINIQRTCGACPNVAMYSCDACFRYFVGLDSGPGRPEEGWAKHYETYHFPVDLV